MRTRIGVASDIGRARERNEDSYLAEEPLFAVADGMGGHRGGAVASSLALETLHSVLRGDQTSPGALIEEIKEANRRVIERGLADRELRGMGTTLTALYADEDKVHIAHIGDSRAYLLRDGSLKQLTEDHSLVQRMVMEGKLKPEEAERHPQRSILTRALGSEQDVEPDTMTVDPVLPGDRLLLCTDGLTSMVRTDTIEQILKGESDPQDAADRLVDEANDAGGEDNITVVVLDFMEGDEGAAGAPPAQTRRAASPAAEQVRDGSGVRRDDTRLTPVASDVAEPEGPRRRRWVRLIAWLGVIVVLIVGALVGTRTYLDRQWYVGVAAGRVAIYNGIPSKVLGMDLSHVVQTTDISATAAEQLRVWRNLPDGINAGSREQAQSIVTQIRQDVAESTRPKKPSKKQSP
ncbi:MAG TPA: Stp1/IreP family PP2C-type Ser/Thr phosphatase [Actinomycetota bacterium]|jgi:protein phosphatase